MSLIRVGAKLCSRLDLQGKIFFSHQFSYRAWIGRKRTIHTWNTSLELHFNGSPWFLINGTLSPFDVSVGIFFTSHYPQYRFHDVMLIGSWFCLIIDMQSLTPFTNLPLWNGNTCRRPKWKLTKYQMRGKNWPGTYPICNSAGNFFSF